MNSTGPGCYSRSKRQRDKGDWDSSNILVSQSVPAFFGMADFQVGMGSCTRVQNQTASICRTICQRRLQTLTPCQSQQHRPFRSVSTLPALFLTC